MSEQPSHLGDEVTPLRRSKDSDHTSSPHSEQELKNYISEPTSENNAHDNDSDTTGTNSSDEFNWDEDDELTGNGNQASPKARRGRALWLAFMKLARPVRTLLVGVLGAGILISPLLVVELKYKDESSVRPQVHAWSLWLSITWAAGCATYLVVDAIPRLAISLLVLYGAQVESLKTQIELALAVSGWVKLALDISWAWIALSAIRAFYKPPGSYWVIINRVMQVLSYYPTYHGVTATALVGSFYSRYNTSRRKAVPTFRRHQLPSESIGRPLG
ncbi:hypothetical protein SERLA73DRAFT_190130 [Serpula lacrymans var. lacrymans S7.3]|uniref:Mechanosensitive ion channel protein Msy1/2-like transmembrane domain-containing protein n=2 Tax=Serpula lacrymans var. lacrymans TaxID=341189 RepID=F8QF48_SERL3|nr:uncharacterized protein SERLADRAFT_461975 [Serpula lacrymans var. lacrymans S7.9]EGN93007.1 hypothetical protein SERLA73DRAFT_190130 [Serpula lacrymans var. lacrymans S7.3]EGO27847.1 hypothetical protein SERLADRAFT_461975 [Serpula lacrymans var. lacrymans S7.9]